MAQQVVGVGTSANDGTGDDLRTAFQKVNSNFTELYAQGAPSVLATFRNKVINGNFDIWQRGTSFTGSAYGPDRWELGSAGTTKTATRQTFTLGQTDVPGNPTYFMRHVVVSSAGASNHCLASQKIENVATFAGQNVVLTFWAKADASRNIAVEFSQFFGTGGSPSASVNGSNGTTVTTVALTTAWTKYTVTTTLPSVSGKTLGSNNDHSLIFNFWFDAGSSFNARTNSLGQQSGTFDIAQVQLEAGSVATAFEDRFLGTELSLCQRYYQAFDLATNIFSGSVTSGSIYYLARSYFVPMRAVPTLVQSVHSTLGFPTTDATEVKTTQDVRFAKTANATNTGGYFQFTFTASAEL